MEDLPLRTPAPKSCNTCSTVLQSNIKDNQSTKGVLRKNSTDSSMVCNSAYDGVSHVRCIFWEPES